MYIGRALWPLVALMNGIANLVTVPLRLGKVDEMDEERVSAEEIRLLTTEAANEGVLTTRERSLILNALSLSDRTAKQIMVPRMRVVWLDLKKSMDENRRTMGERLFSRLPLGSGTLDNIIGVVHTKEFLSAYNAAGDSSVLQLIAREPVFVPESLPVERILATFREKKTQMVIVLDEYGGLAGVVTLRDVVDDLLGAVGQSVAMTTQAMRGEVEPPDKSGEAGISGDIEQKPVTVVVPGDTGLHELGQRFDRRAWASHESVATVSGLLQERLGHIPAAGEFVEVEGVRLRVLEADARTAKSVEVTLLPEAEEGKA